MTHFDFDDRYQDELVVGSAISRREGVVWSIVGHVVLIAILLYLPRLAWFQPTAEELEQQRLELLAQLKQQQDAPVFMLAEPLRDIPTEQPRERVDLSDLDRRSTTVERAPVPENTLPASRGNTSERVEAAPPAAEPKGEEAPPEPERQPEQQIARNTTSALPRPIEPPRPPPGSIIGEAVRNLQQYARNQTFDNPQGGNTDRSESIQFDSKGVDFGPWLRRFVSQVRRNWFIPQSAMTFRGHVVLQFYIHRDGRITDVNVVQPSDIASFNRAAFDAIVGSNPTEPLPAAYPDDKALFTVTFYYNERPPSGS